MDATRRSKRRLWSQQQGKFDTEPPGYGDYQSACGSFKAQCTAEMKPITDEESDGLSIAKRDASPQDQRPSCLGARPKEKIDANRDINYADKGLEEEKIQVLLEVIFNIRTRNGIKDTVKFQCDVRKYMIWKYMMNSPSQCERCSKHFSSDNENIALTTDSVITILSPVNNREHAARIAKKVFDYAIGILGPILTFSKYKLKERDIDKGTEQLNKTFGEEIAFAATVNKCIYIVFPTLHRKEVDLLLQEANDIEEGLIKETVRLKRVLFKFPKVIEVCKRNANIVQENDEQENKVVCTVSGRKDDVLNAISELENMEKHLKMKDLSFSPRISNVLKHLFVEDIVNERLMEENPFCVLEQTENYFRLYSFNETELSKASDFVSHLIVESSEKMIGNCKNTLQHLKKHFKKGLLVDWDSRNCKLYMMGLSDAVEAARAQIVDIQEGRVIEGKASELELQVTEVYNVRNTLHLRYFESSVFTNNIADKFKVKVAFCQKEYSINVTGFERDVKSALETFLNIEKEIVTTDTLFCQKKAVQYFATESSSTFLKETENCNNVLIEKHKLKVFGDKNFQVLKDTYKSYVTWSTSKKRYIYLEQMSLEKVSALVKIKPVASDILEGNIIKGGYIVEMGIPVWKDGKHSENEDLDKALSNVLNNISQTKEETVAFSLSPVAHWGFSEFMKSVVNHSVKWLFASQCHKAHTVKLCVEDEQCFSVTDAYMDQCVDYLKRGTRLTRELETTVCKGQLDKIKADVLVNTAATNFDLTKGYVSAALARRAGPQLQTECKKRYPNGITVDDVAETNGYQADCTKIFHVTLLPYSVEDASECKKVFRNVMMHCLKRATSYGYASIAFPAMGNGSLRYPVEVVASEMFGTVEKFKEECPNTTLQRVMFVIYERDEELLEYFNKIEKDTSQQKAMLRGRPAVKVTITGTKENVHHAKSHIEEELAESNESVTKCIDNVSSAEFQAVENLYSIQMTSFRDRGVDMRHVEMHDELLLTGDEDLLDDAYKTVGGYLDRINKMQRCEVPVTNISSSTVEEAILDMRYSRRGICYTFDKNFSTVTILADSEKLVHEAEEEIKKKLGFGCSVSGSPRFEEKMDTSDTEVLDSVASITAKPLVRRTFSWSKDSKHLREYQQKDIVVKVYEANILEVPVDAIVNAANEDLQHCGGVAYAIAKAAGVELIRESEALMRQNKGSLDVTSVVCTTAGSLNYKCILHAVGPRWSSYQPITKSSLKQCGKDLKQTIVNCLQLAEEKGCVTIALPTISSGIFKVPKDMCATQYAKAVLKFKGKHILKEIHFVDVDPSMIDILRKTYDAMITKKRKSPFDVNLYVDRKPRETSQPAVDENGKFYAIHEREYNHLERKPKQKNTSIHTSFISDGSTLKCSFGTNPQVEIYVGDIVNLSGIQAIACSEDKNAQSKGILAQLLLKKGGDEYRREKHSRFANIRKHEEVIITSAGTNTFDWIIHAVVPHKDTISIAYRNILKAANERKLTSQALPLLGTGFGGIDEVTSTEELFDELLQFYQNNRSSLLKVHIVLKDKVVASVVQDVFKRRINDIKQERKFAEKEKTFVDINTKTTTREQDSKEENEKTSVDMKTKPAIKEKGKTATYVDNSVAEEDCVICMDKVTDGVKLKCGHVFGQKCIDPKSRIEKEYGESSEIVTKYISDVSSAEFEAVQNFYDDEITYIRDRGVIMRHVKSHREVLLTGGEDLLEDAFKTVSGYLNHIKKLQICEVPVTKISTSTVEEAKHGMRYTFDKNFSTITKLASNTKDLDDVASETAKRVVQRKFSWSKDSKHLRLYQQRDIVVRVYETNILGVPVDVIVNAANKDLRHCGGVANAIAKAAGVELIRESEGLVRQNKGSLDVTSVVSTSPGYLDYKCILHAVGPRWPDYQPITKQSLRQCEKDLTQTVVKCLQLAEEKSMTSIALPTISSGHFHVPNELCAKQYAQALIEFSSTRRHSLKDIHFVDTSSETIEVVQNTFDAMITQGKPAPFDTSVFIEQTTTGARITDLYVIKDNQSIKKNTAKNRSMSLAQTATDIEQTVVDDACLSTSTKPCTVAKNVVKNTARDRPKRLAKDTNKKEYTKATVYYV